MARKRKPNAIEHFIKLYNEEDYGANRTILPYVAIDRDGEIIEIVVRSVFADETGYRKTWEHTLYSLTLHFLIMCEDE